MNIKSLKTYQKLLIVTVIVTIMFVGYFLRNISQERTPQITQNPIITPPPLRIDQTITQKLIIDWQDAIYQGPNSAPLITVKTPLVSVATILDLSKKFNFNNSHEIDTKRSDSYLWVSGTKSLSGTTPNGPLTYANYTLASTGSFSSKDQGLETIIKSLNNLIDTSKVQLIPNTNSVDIFNPDLENQPGSSTNPGFASADFYQSFNGIPFYPPTVNNSVLRIATNTKGDVRYLEITSGVQDYESTEPKNLKNFETLKPRADQFAQRITFVDNEGEDEEKIRALATVHLKVTNIDLIYSSNFTDNILQPVYRISGIYTDKEIEGMPVQYIIPAL